MPLSTSSSDPQIPRIHARRLPRPTKRELARRSAVIAEVSAKRFAGVAFRQVRHARHGPLPLAVLAQPLRKTFEDLGGTYMKFGQLVASSPGVFGEEFSDEFRTCLDTGPTVPFKIVREVIESDLGMPLHEAFTHFDPSPIGRASIAVVHRATLHDGTDVAVKVLRPGIESMVSVDLDLLQPLLEMVAKQTGDQAAGTLMQLFSGFRVQIGEELDLRNEARSLAAFSVLLDEFDLPLVVVPKPFPAFSGTNVLTMEFLDGVPIDDLAGAAKFGVDPAPLVEQVVRAFFLTTVRWGAFHGDVHAGNMLLLRDGRIGIIDWGIVGRLDPETHYFFIRLLEAVLGNEEAWGDIAAHLTRTYGPAMQQGLGLSDDELAGFVRGLIEPILMRPFGEVSLGALIQAPQVQAAKAQGIEAHNRSARAVAGRLRAQRKLRRLADESGGTDSEFDRGTFLLGKQLMYFERYGKMFLADVPLFHDRAFFESVVASAPTLTRMGTSTLPLTPRGDESK
jgi:predicted unusual protein kinase regulating ubiquinone biosynthesis (AarF/ABC1/UbiB family)